MRDRTESMVLNYRIREWFPDISPALHDNFKSLYDELMKFNKSLNLISAKTMAHADLIHFADSILGSRAIRGSKSDIKEIYDLGSGNGFPAVIFAMLFPDVSVKMVDSDTRKCEYLKHLVSHFKIKNAEVLCQTVETLPLNSIEYAMARGFANISKTILTARKFMKSGGAVFHFKSEEWSLEVGEIPTQLCSLWTPSLAAEYTLPAGGVKFAIVKTVKMG